METVFRCRILTRSNLCLLACWGQSAWSLDDDPIDAAAEAGGTVTLKPGTYLTGSLFLISEPLCNSMKGSALVGPQKLDDYDAASKNISKNEHPHRDLSTALRFGRDDKGEDGASIESSCSTEPELVRWATQG